MFQTDRILVRYIKLAGGQEYPYFEFPITQQESLHGFYLEVTATKLTLAVTASSLLFGLTEMDPVAETAANTIYGVNGAAATKRILGDINFDFTVHLTNRVLIRPALAIGAVTPPAIMLPIVGLYMKTDGLRLSIVYKSKGDI